MRKILLGLLTLLLNLYANNTEVSMDLNKSALILIEFQNEWLGEKGKLPILMKDKEQFATSKIAAKKALESARERGLKVIHAGLFLSDDYKEFGKEKAHYGLKSAIQKFGTWKEYGSLFAEGFTPLSNEFIVKGRMGTSAFAGSNLEVYLKNNGIDRLYIMGYATHVCVESTLRDGHDRGYEVVVLHDATSAFTKEQKDYFLEHIVHHFGATITVEEFIK